MPRLIQHPLGPFEYIAIVANPHQHPAADPIAVYGIGRYERSSVLAGQPRRVFLDSFDTVDEAKRAYPKATDNAGLPPRASVPLNPPPGFDPLDAGERWSEDY